MSTTPYFDPADLARVLAGELPAQPAAPALSPEIIRLLAEAGVQLPRSLRPPVEEVSAPQVARELDEAAHARELDAKASAGISGAPQAPRLASIAGNQAALFAEQQAREQRDLDYWRRTQGLEVTSREPNTIAPTSAGQVVSLPLDALPPAEREYKLAGLADLLVNGRADLIPADTLPAVQAFLAIRRAAR